MKKLLALNLLLLLPLAYLFYTLFMQEAQDPVKFIYTVTGATALTLLYFTTSISLLKKRMNLLRYRRTVGLYSFLYAFLHMLNFIIFDMELDFGSVFKETLEKPFIYLGMGAFFILLFMAVTSLRIFFSKYYKYHKVIYLAIIFASVHFVMAQKALSINQYFYLAVMVLIGIFKLLQRTKLVKF